MIILKLPPYSLMHEIFMVPRSVDIFLAAVIRLPSCSQKIEV